MYNKPRPLDTTIVGMRSKGITYYLDFSGDDKDKIKTVAYKDGSRFKMLSKKDGRYILKLSAVELQDAAAEFGYSLVITYKDKTTKTLTGKVVLKR